MGEDIMSLPDNRNLREFLRENTRSIHERLDDGLGESAFESLQTYKVFLRNHYASVSELESILEKSGITEYIKDWELRKRSSALQADLSSLGELPQMKESAVTELNKSQCVGILYVLEGSRIGNRYLLKKAMAVSRGIPVQFLEHGKGLKLWESFLGFLSSVDVDLNQSLSGAQFAFRLFCRNFGVSVEDLVSENYENA